MTVVTKTTWATRRIPPDLAVSWASPNAPRVGDVLLCEVVRPQLHSRVETAEGTRAKLYPGDRIACVLGNRYATETLEGAGVLQGETAELLSASGLCGMVLSRHDRANPPTTLRVLGQGFVDALPLHVGLFALEPPLVRMTHPVAWFLVVGSGMGSGKTTACASLINGLVSQGHRVGAAKLTGTASARDPMSYRDAGATSIVDFSDFGWASTAGCRLDELVRILDQVTACLESAGVDVAVLEVADGLLQTETAILLPQIATRLRPLWTVFTVRESLSAIAGMKILDRHGLRVAAVSGTLTSSPLSSREVLVATEVPCIPTGELGERLAAVAAIAADGSVAADAGVA